jgi:hypothetical protein
VVEKPLPGAGNSIDLRQLEPKAPLRLTLSAKG